MVCSGSSCSPVKTQKAGRVGGKEKFALFQMPATEKAGRVADVYPKANSLSLWQVGRAFLDRRGGSYMQNQQSSLTAAAAKSLQSCPTLCDPIDGSPTGSAIPGILQARTLEWAAISFSNAWKWKVKVKSLSRVQLFTTPWTACSPPGSSVHGIFQARVLEWDAIAFSGHL